MASKTVVKDGTPDSSHNPSLVDSMADAIIDHATTIDTLNANIGGTLTADAPGRAKVAAGFFDAATVDSVFAVNVIGQELLENELDGTSVANVADVAVSPASLVPSHDGWYSYTHADHATETLAFTLNRKAELVDFKIIKIGADAGGTVQLQDSAAAAISDVMVAAVDKALTRCAQLDTAKTTINAAGQFKIAFTRGGGASGSRVLVQILLRA